MRIMRWLVAGLVCAISGIALHAVQLAPLQAHLEKQLKTWQKRLSMNDWDLSVQVVRKSALDKNTWGNAEWDTDTKSGVISVLDPQDYNLKGTKTHSTYDLVIYSLLIVLIATVLIGMCVKCWVDVCKEKRKKKVMPYPNRTKTPVFPAT